MASLVAVAILLATAPAGAASPLAAPAVTPATSPFPNPYVSPYQVTGVNAGYTGDLAAREQSYVTGVTSPGGQPTVYPALADWYNSADSVWGSPGNASWGAEPFVLAQPTLPSGLSAAQTLAYYRQRIVQVASDYIGTPYQHHHVPAWNPFAPANGGASPVQAPFPDPMPAGQWAWSAVSTNAMSTQPGPVLVNGQWQMSTVTFANQYASTYGTGQQGIDCSDLTALAYSVAAGVYINSAVGAQGVVNASGAYSGTSPIGWNNAAVPSRINPQVPTNASITPIVPQFLIGPNSTYSASTNQRSISTWNAPGSLDYVESQLQPGDLLYISNSYQPGNNVTHVVIWLGVYGTTIDPVSGTATKVPLVISSHDNTPAVLDANAPLPPMYPASGAGNMPPPGVHILPFAQNNWFYSNFSHAMRLLPSGTGQASSGGAVLFGSQAVGGSSAARSATITNTGTAPVSVTGAATIAGAGAGQFALAAGNTCTGTTLAPGGSCVVPLTFSPTSPGGQSASLVVPTATFGTAASAPVYVSLIGSGVQSQSISFAPPSSVALASASLPLAASASSGLPVGFSSTTPAVCTVDGSVAALLAAGLCGITATQAGSGSFAAAPSVAATISVTGRGAAAGSGALAGVPDNPESATIAAPGVVLVGQRIAESTEPRVMRNPPTARPAAAPVVTAAAAAPLALGVTGLSPGLAYVVRIRVDGRTVDLGSAQAGTDGQARLPVFALTRPGTYTLVVVSTATGRRSYITVKVGPRPS